MNCADLEILICDYLDGTLGPDEKADVERHLARCAGCAELAKDAGAAVAFLERVPAVEPPPELLTRSCLSGLQETGGSRLPSELAGEPGAAFTATAVRHGGRADHPVVLHAGQIRRAADAAVASRGPRPGQDLGSPGRPRHRTWERSVKFYESIRFVYEIQSRLREWRTQQDEQEREAANSELRDRQLKVRRTPGQAAPERTGADAPQTGKSK